jgi:tetratricopeptide (TPR) repeat protein
MRSFLLLIFLWLTAFCLAVQLEPRYRSALSPSGRSSDALAILLGDSRELFARHLYAKADAYFHSGYYPTIFDQQSDEMHLSNSPNQSPDSHHSDGVDWLGAPKDWLDRFSRHFYPTEHRHLGEKPHPEGEHDDHAQPGSGEHGEEGAEHDEHGAAPKEDREILPWLRLSATLNPEQPQTYVVASFWLRTQLGKSNEAEQFLREGLRNNPGHPELLFELGRIYRENHKDNERARNILEVALKNWRDRSADEREKNPLLTAQLLAHLAQLEEEAGHYPQAIEYLKELATFSPNKKDIEEWIADLSKRAKP